jgi:hypothetical protein
MFLDMTSNAQFKIYHSEEGHLSILLKCCSSADGGLVHAVNNPWLSDFPIQWLRSDSKCSFYKRVPIV